MHSLVSVLICSTFFGDVTVSFIEPSQDYHILFFAIKKALTDKSLDKGSSFRTGETNFCNIYYNAQQKGFNTD